MTDPTFQSAVDALLQEEGGYTNPAESGLPDRGGVTNFGITERFARATGYTGDMRAMTRAEAVSIYELMSWRAPQLDLLAAIDGPIAARLFDIGVMSGQATAGRFLQRALNALNDRGQLYSLRVDGVLGAVTRAALSYVIGKRGVDGRRVVLGMVTALHSVHLIQIVEVDATQGDFEFGWQLRAIGHGLVATGTVVAGAPRPPASDGSPLVQPAADASA